jgi:aminoglycoside phosphotransferase (APT) family kinase protein
MAAQETEQTLRNVFRKFQIPGDLLIVERLRTGHINETYSATCNQAGARVRYLLQKLNGHVFKNPRAVMSNVLRVTSHIRAQLENEEAAEISRRCLTVIPARTGEAWHRDGKGEYWRVFLFIEGARTFERAETPSQAFEAGRAFGEFQRRLANLSGAPLAVTIPGFHDTRRRFRALMEAARKDRCKRASGVRAELAFAERRESLCGVLLDAMAAGSIPERTTHNDTKFNNVMLDSRSGKGLCVVDLDTVMPGCALYDFGDLVRTTVSPAIEDERDLSKIRVRTPLFRGLARGYLSAAGEVLNRAERSRLAFSGKLISFELGLRFLTDYLDGDRYFRVHRRDQNRDRCRAQFKLVEAIECREEALQAIADAS